MDKEREERIMQIIADNRARRKEEKKEARREAASNFLKSILHPVSSIREKVNASREAKNADKKFADDAMSTYKTYMNFAEGCRDQHGIRNRVNGVTTTTIVYTENGPLIRQIQDNPENNGAKFYVFQGMFKNEEGKLEFRHLSALDMPGFTFDYYGKESSSPRQMYSRGFAMDLQTGELTKDESNLVETGDFGFRPDDRYREDKHSTDMIIRTMDEFNQFEQSMQEDATPAQ